MIIDIFAFYDKKSGELTNPCFVQNVDILVRGLSKELEDVNNQALFKQFPEDFSIYKVGSFDTEAVKKDNAEFILNVADYVPKSKEKEKE